MCGYFKKGLTFAQYTKINFMKKILLGLGVLMTGASFAQNTFTTANKTPDGTYTYFVCDSVGSLANVTGANVTWDYSSIKSLPDTTAMLIIGAVPQSDTFGFTAANKLINTGLFTADYLNASTGEIREGMVITDIDLGLVVAKFTTQPTVMNYPFAYQDTINDTFAGKADAITLGLTDRPLSGEHLTTYDGYGTLKLGALTIQDVSRITMVDSFKIDTQDPGVGIIDVILTQMRYYTLGTSTEPVFLFNKLEILLPDNGSLIRINTMSKEDPTDYTSTSEIDAINFKIYPNPAKNSLNVSGDFEQATIQVVDQVGKIVLEKTLNNNQTNIDLGELNSGMYIVKANINGHLITKKLIKE